MSNVETGLPDSVTNQAELSDDQLKENLKKQFAKAGGQSGQSKSYQFPTEIIDLPSKGLIYPKDNSLSSGQIEIKYMTAKEEDILTTQTFIKKGVVIDKLLQSLIVSDINYDDLLVGDKNQIMIDARILGYDKNYKVKVTDPFDPDNEQEVDIDLTTLQTKDIDESVYNNENRFSYTLPKSKINIEFRLMTIGLEKQVKEELKKNRFNSRGVSRELSTRLKKLILSVGGNEDRLAINEFVDNMLSMDSRAFREHLNSLSPDVDLEFDFVSDTTGEVQRMTIPFDSGFFYPGN